MLWTLRVKRPCSDGVDPQGVTHCISQPFYTEHVTELTATKMGPGGTSINLTTSHSLSLNSLRKVSKAKPATDMGCTDQHGGC